MIYVIEYIILCNKEALMKIYAPRYYKDFICIADKCKHSCCVGWEIDIDEKTICRYDNLSNDYATIINNSIVTDESTHFVLDFEKHCPHLNKNGVCDIILNCGDDYLCDICREHPRFYNFTNRGKEVGVGMSCEAACKLILDSDEFDLIDEIGTDDSEVEEYTFDAVEIRDQIFKVLKDNSLFADKKTEAINNQFIPSQRFEFFDIISDFEYLDDAHRDLFSQAKDLIWNNEYSDKLCRILAYYIYRHCSEAYDFEEFSASLSFAIFCTGLVSTLSVNNDIYDIARIVSEEIEYSEDNTYKIKSMFY